MPETRPLLDPVEDGWKIPGWLTVIIAVAVVVCLVVAFIVPPSAPEPSSGDQPAVADRAAQTVLEIESAMEAYSGAHGGRFPTGKSSTEVFQKLLDEHFIKDPRLFYLEMNGKSAPGSNVLTPDNVAFDVTVPIDLTTPGYVPVVFSTGYRIEYKPGGRAVPLPGNVRPDACQNGILIAYPKLHAFFTPEVKANGVAAVPVIAPGAAIDAGTYTQLTPDGPLPSP